MFRIKLDTLDNGTQYLEPLTDKDNFECADPRLVKKGPTACGEHQTPVDKLIQRQKINYMTLLYDCECPKLEFLRYHFSFYLCRIHRGLMVQLGAGCKIIVRV